MRSVPHLPFAHRLLKSLEAAQAAGGDCRGQQSAALYITHHEPYPYLDLRVDHHSQPLEQLGIILAESNQDYYQSFLQAMPKSKVLNGQYSRLSSDINGRRSISVEG